MIILILLSSLGTHTPTYAGNAVRFPPRLCVDCYLVSDDRVDLFLKGE